VTDRLVEIGRIVGLYGVQGWVRLESYTDPRKGIFAYQPWLLTFGDGERKVDGVQGRELGNGIVAKLAGYDDRDAAATLVGATIRIRRAQLPKPKRGEYYWTDLEGLEVETIDGHLLGKVVQLLATGANDVLVVRDGTRERMIPFVPGQFVREVDLEHGRISVDWDPDF
jgi:16S rRNA processing protein RimM